MIAFYADKEDLGHGFIKVRPYNDPNGWRGYGFYPTGDNPLYCDGTIVDDTRHVWDRKLCFRINQAQFDAVMAKVAEWQSATYRLTGNNCVSFAYDVDEAIGDNITDTLDVPEFLYNRLGNYSQHVDNTNASRSSEVQETEAQIIDIRGE